MAMQISTLASSSAAAVVPGLAPRTVSGTVSGTVPQAGLSGDAGEVAEAPFGNALKSAIDNIDGLGQQASNAVTGLLAGSGVDIHDAMIATQKADMSFELALAVRNKAVAAYQQVMGMQF
jgi:flagellar hook-basal body complex protein FliE